LITSDEEKIRLAELSLRVGNKARTSAAYAPALHYCQLGLQLLPPDGWQTHYQLALMLHTDAAEVAYLSGNFEQMERMFEAVLQHGKSVLDKVKVYEVRIEAYIAQNKPEKAIQTALPVLKELIGVQFPEKPSMLQTGLGFLQTVTRLGMFHFGKWKRIEDLAELPEMTDPYKIAATQIIYMAEPTSIMTAPELFMLFVLKRIELSVKYGNAVATPDAYATYGTVLLGAVGDIDNGYRFGNMALKLSEQPSFQKYKSNVLMVMYSTLYFWKNHLSDTLVPLLEAYQIASMSGRLDTAAYALAMHDYHTYFLGHPLTELEKQITKHGATIEQYKQEATLGWHQACLQAVLNLLGQYKEDEENPTQLVGTAYNEETMLPRYHEANDQSALHFFHVHKLLLCYLFQDYSQAVENGILAEKYVEAVLSAASVPVLYFYDSLARLAIYPESKQAEQKQILKKVKANQKKMTKWAKYAPMNFQHKVYLVEAEQARVLDKVSPNPIKEMEARVHYDRAIELAREHGYLNEEALAYELAGSFYLTKGQTKLGQNLFTRGLLCLSTLGRVGKTPRIGNPLSQTICSGRKATAC
jgi:predicted ATPase